MARVHTHYDNLKVARDASTDVIRAAYRKLLQKYHPDRNPGDAEAARIVRIINSSYGVLADPIKRKKHDLWIAARRIHRWLLGRTSLTVLKRQPHQQPLDLRKSSFAALER